MTWHTLGMFIIGFVGTLTVHIAISRLAKEQYDDPTVWAAIITAVVMGVGFALL